MPNINLAAVIPSAKANLVVKQRAIPTPGPNEILIRNHAIGINPIDWKRQAFDFAIPSYPTVLGTDLSGIVAAVGPGVTSFQPGDRVLGAADGMRSGNPDHASFQTYTVVSAAAATKLPDAVSFAQGATLPTAVGTAALALVDVLGLPLPGAKPLASSEEDKRKGILIWGGASSVGAAAVRLARVAGLKVFTTASPKHHTRLRALGVAAVVDYRSPSAVADLVAAAKQAGADITLALDAVVTQETAQLVVEVLDKFDGAKKVAHLSAWPEKVAKPEGVEAGWVNGTRIWVERKDLGELVFNQLLRGWLEIGEVVPGMARVVERGIGGLQAALDELRKGISGDKKWLSRFKETASSDNVVSVIA